MNSESKPPGLYIGITGGIGSGKSTICRLFAEMGRFVINADAVARHLTDYDPKIRAGIKRVFGANSYLPTGLLDRKRMAATVFTNKKKRSTLDTIVHPRVFESVSQQVAGLPPEQSTPYVAIEAALIYESGMDELLDYVLVVAANEETCIQRVMKRDGITGEEVLQRIRSQMSQDEKVKHADFVFRNDGGLDELRSAISFLDTIFSQLKHVERS